MTDVIQTSERFKEVGDCPIESVQIEDGKLPPGQHHVGKLWLGAEWITVEQARALRDWLNKVIP